MPHKVNAILFGQTVKSNGSYSVVTNIGMESKRSPKSIVSLLELYWLLNILYSIFR